MVVLKVGLAVGVFSGCNRNKSSHWNFGTKSDLFGMLSFGSGRYVLILLTTDARSVGSSLKETSILLSSSLDVYGGARGTSDAIVLRRSFPSR